MRVQKRYLLFFLLILPGVGGFGQQDTLTLRKCIKAARENAAVNSQYKLVQELADLKTANARAMNLPTLSAYGKASYQSDAVSIELPMGGGVEVDLFQYNTGIEARQKIYDGGLSRRLKLLESSVVDAESEKINTELYQLSSKVTDLFFQELLLEKNRLLVELKEEILLKRLDDMELGVENGLLKANDLESMQAELLSVRQQIIQIEKLKQQIHSSLMILTGLEQGEYHFMVRDSLFLVPEMARPEKFYFKAEQQKLENMAYLQQAQNLPKLYAFGQAGYSYPGLNFFENEPDYYYIVGARLSWTIFDWKQNKREATILRKQKENISIREADFDQNIELGRKQELIEQEQLRRMMAMDEEIIRQRSAVTTGSETALAEGIITTADYLEDLNQEIKARLDAETRKIELQYSVIQLKILEGIDLKHL